MKKSIIRVLFLSTCYWHGMAQSPNAAYNHLNTTEGKEKSQMMPFDIEGYRNHVKHEHERYRGINAVGNEVEQFGSEEFGYIETETEPGSLFEYFKQYYPNGTIKRQGMCYKRNFAMGIWQYYSPEGYFINEEDTDKLYSYTWNDVKNFAATHQIDLYDPITRITRGHDEDYGLIWVIFWRVRNDENPVKTVYLSAEDGKILAQYEAVTK